METVFLSYLTKVTLWGNISLNPYVISAKIHVLSYLTIPASSSRYSIKVCIFVRVAYATNSANACLCSEDFCWNQVDY